jgi:biotin synthase
MGEDWTDRLDMMFTLRELGVDVMPINFLNAIHGTPLEGPADAAADGVPEDHQHLRASCSRRQSSRSPAGARKVLRDLQSWIFFAGADSTMIGNYLTTYGRSPEMDHQMVRDLGPELARLRRRGGRADLPDPTLSRVSHTGKHSIPILYEREVAVPEPARA